MPAVSHLSRAGEVSLDDEPFPRRLAASVWLVQFYNGIQYSLPFTLGVFLVRSFEGKDATEQRIGQLTGLLAAASSFAVGCSAWPWGLCSDRWLGRKAVILIGNVATSGAILLFGSSRRYAVALAARFIAGILDGSLVMTKVMVGETCSPHMQARVMSFLALGDAMGTIVGPALGGLLAEPCAHFLTGSRFCNSESLLQQRPYLLPCLVSASLGVITTVSNVLTMDETLPRMRHKRGNRYTLLQEEKATELTSQAPLTPGRARSGSLDLSATTVDPPDSVLQHVSESELVDQPRTSPSHPSQTDTQHPAPSHSPWQNHRERSAGQHSRIRDNTLWEVQATSGGGSDPVGEEEEEEDAGEEDDDGQRRRLLPHDSVASTGAWAGRKAHEKEGGLDVRWSGKRLSGLGSSPSTTEIEAEEDPALAHKPGRDPESGDDVLEAPWWQNRSLLLTLLVTAWMLSISKYCDELAPVFVSAPIANGGLNLPMDKFAWPLSFGGVCVTVYALFLYPRLQRLLGLKNTCGFGLLLGVPSSLIIPSCALLLARPTLEQVVLYAGVGLAYLQKQTAFTSSMVIVNTLAPRGQLGSVNGVRMTLSALGRATGPIAGGFLWGYSASLHFPGHHFIGFAVASLAYAGCWLLHQRIPLDLP